MVIIFIVMGIIIMGELAHCYGCVCVCAREQGTLILIEIMYMITVSMMLMVVCIFLIRAISIWDIIFMIMVWACASFRCACA